MIGDLARAVDTSLGSEPHRMKVGMRPLDLAEWVDDLPDYEAQLVEKRRVLDECDDVVAALPGTEASQAEVLRRLANHVAKRFPERYERQPDEPGDNLAHQLGVNGPHGYFAPVEPTVSCLHLIPL